MSLWVRTSSCDKTDNISYSKCMGCVESRSGACGFPGRRTLKI